LRHVLLVVRVEHRRRAGEAGVVRMEDLGDRGNGSVIAGKGSVIAGKGSAIETEACVIVGNDGGSAAVGSWSGPLPTSGGSPARPLGRAKG
jgi:isoaspartyl peptidase/L-asparaginase-like protein (Ntn-hydrolase superfamily)